MLKQKTKRREENLLFPLKKEEISVINLNHKLTQIAYIT